MYSESDPKQMWNELKQLVTNKPRHQQRLCNLTRQFFTVTHTDTDKMLPSNLKLTTTYLFWYEAHQMFGSFFLAQISNESLRPISQIPQFIRQHPKMQHFVREMCTFLLQNCVLWDIGLVHCGTFAADLFTEEFIRIGKEREFRRWIKWIS